MISDEISEKTPVEKVKLGEKNISSFFAGPSIIVLYPCKLLGNLQVTDMRIQYFFCMRRKASTKSSIREKNNNRSNMIGCNK